MKIRIQPLAFVKPFIFLALASQLTNCQSRPVLAPAPPEKIGEKPSLDSSHEKIEKHANYLAMTVPYQPVQKIFAEVQKREGLTLITRGEAHITVITPPEFEILSKNGITIETIDALAEKLEIQKSEIKPVCVGRGQAKIDDKDERTYFVVVSANRLLELRTQLESLLKEKTKTGAKSFSAADYKPHVTLGFTKTDLYAQNGVIKDDSSCVYAFSK